MANLLDGKMEVAVAPRGHGLRCVSVPFRCGAKSVEIDNLRWISVRTAGRAVAK